MKNYIAVLLLFFSLAGANLNAQKCRYEKETLDAKTEMEIKRTEPVEITRVNDQPFYVKAQCIGKHKYLKVRYYLYNGFKIRESEPLEIIFLDDTSVKLKAREMPEKRNTGGFRTVSSLLIYNLTKDQYKQLLEKPAVQIKYFIEGGGYIRKDIRSRYQHDIQHIMKCVLLDADDI